MAKEAAQNNTVETSQHNAAHTTQLLLKAVDRLKAIRDDLNRLTTDPITMGYAYEDKELNVLAEEADALLKEIWRLEPKLRKPTLNDLVSEINTAIYQIPVVIGKLTKDQENSITPANLRAQLDFHLAKNNKHFILSTLETTLTSASAAQILKQGLDQTPPIHLSTLLNRLNAAQSIQLFNSSNQVQQSENTDQSTYATQVKEKLIARAVVIAARHPRRYQYQQLAISMLTATPGSSIRNPTPATRPQQQNAFVPEALFAAIKDSAHPLAIHAYVAMKNFSLRKHLKFASKQNASTFILNFCKSISTNTDGSIPQYQLESFRNFFEDKWYTYNPLHQFITSKGDGYQLKDKAALFQLLRDIKNTPHGQLLLNTLISKRPNDIAKFVRSTDLSDQEKQELGLITRRTHTTQVIKRAPTETTAAPTSSPHHLRDQANNDPNNTNEDAARYTPTLIF